MVHIEIICILYPQLSVPRIAQLVERLTVEVYHDADINWSLVRFRLLGFFLHMFARFTEFILLELLRSFCGWFLVKT